MALSESIRKEVQRFRNRIRAFLDKITLIEQSYVKPGMGDQEREAALTSAFPEVKEYALAEATAIMEEAGQKAEAARALKDALLSQAKRARVPAEALPNVEAAAAQAAKRLESFYKGLDHFMYGIIKSYQQDFTPQAALETLRSVIIISPEFERGHIDSIVSPIESAENAIVTAAAKAENAH
jgi:hypothetical protein